MPLNVAFESVKPDSFCASCRRERPETFFVSFSNYGFTGSLCRKCLLAQVLMFLENGKPPAAAKPAAPTATMMTK